VFFAKLTKILAGIFIFLLIFQLLQQLGRKKAKRYSKNQSENIPSNRKYVESNIVESSNQTNDEARP